MGVKLGLAPVVQNPKHTLSILIMNATYHQERATQSKKSVHYMINTYHPHPTEQGLAQGMNPWQALLY